jgi:hypothetical protein
MSEMNTIRAIDSLTQTGFSEEQARAVVGVVAEGIDNRAVTKQDFAGFDSKLDAKFARLEASIANAKVQVVLYTGAMVAFVAAITKLFA